MNCLHCRVVAVAVYAALLLVQLALKPCDAAIGIFNWYAVPDCTTASINYFLNLEAESGSITIRTDNAGSPGTAVRTITLSQPDLTSGAHSVVWDGKMDDGSDAPHGSYFAEISVQAALVPAPEDPNNPNLMPANRKMIKTNGYFYGVAVDTNPANNNQQDPSKSTYGLIYVSNVFGPTSTTGKIDVYRPDGTYKTTLSAIIPGKCSPSGLSVGSDGCIYTASKELFSIYNLLPDGQTVLGGNVSGVLTGGGAAWGSIADGTARFQVPAKNTIYEWRMLPEPVPLNNDPNKLTNFDSENRLEIPVNLECTQTARDPLTGNIYAAHYNTLGVCSLRRYTWNGSGYDQDLNWEPAIGSTVDAVAVLVTDPNILVVGRQYYFSNPIVQNLERWYVEHPDPDIAGPALIDSYKVVTRVIHNVASDSRGNVIFDADGDDRLKYQRQIGMFIFPDNGSEDTRTAGPFIHEGPAEVELKSRIHEVAYAAPGTAVQLQGKVVSLSSGNVLYVQEADRTRGIRVELATPQSIQPGTVLDVTGSVDFSLGEIRLTGASTSNPVYGGEPPKPLAIHTAKAANDPSQRLNFVGINNYGLLVRTTGEVTSIDLSAGLLYIDDGCGLDNGFGKKGIAVKFSGFTPAVLEGDFIAATGISSCTPKLLIDDRIINGIPTPAGTTVYEPVVLTRCEADIDVLRTGN